jgi:cell division protein FtsQ
MDRSIAAPGPRRLLRKPTAPGFGLTRPRQGAAKIGRNTIAFAWERRPLRIALIAVLVAIPLLAGGWWLARHTALTRVEHVRIDGLQAVHGASSGAIEAALMGAVHNMSTLDVQPSALRAAVASYPIVRSVGVHASFPHELRIEVLEQPPVAELAVDGVRTAVAADGIVLGPNYLSSSLPLLNAGKAAAASPLPAVGHSVRGGSLLQALSVLGAAPPALARAVTNVYSGSKGLTLELRGGLLAYFGDGTRAHAKWIALTRVLADPSSTGAAYIDVRLPERSAAGFAPGTTRPDTSSSENEPSSASDPATAAELAAGLDTAVSGGSSTSTSSGTGSAGSSSSSSEPPPPGESTTGSTSSTEPGSSTTTGSPGSSESEASG